MLVLEKCPWPRDKVCGDCLNPNALPLLRELGLLDELRRRPHAAASRIVLQDSCGRSVETAAEGDPVLVVRRRDFDDVLVVAARAAGAGFLESTAVQGVEPGWRVETTAGVFSAPVLVAADGRNSTVARLLGLLPPARRDRAARQSHVPAHGAWRESIGLLLSRHGYAGVAPVDEATLNVCLVARPERQDALIAEMTSRIGLPAEGGWKSLAPLARRPVSPAPRPGLFLLGDAARVVEPFTGEGIYYAMRGAQLAAAALLESPDLPAAARRYRADHARLYRGRLWPNLLARWCVEHPAAGDGILRLGRIFPAVLRGLSGKVTRVRRPL